MASRKSFRGSSEVFMEETDNFDRVYTAALNILALREHSEKELREKLVRKFGSAGETTDRVIARLSELGYLSDVRYAEMAVRHFSGKGYGPHRIRAELLKKGVNPEEQEACPVPDDEEFVSRARSLVEKKYGAPEDMDFAARRKAMAFLARRGFTGEQCLKALRADADDFGGDW